MTKCKLSIIIPLYQKAYFIRECVASLYAQGIGEDMFEVIIVDDGSTDGGGKIADAIMQERPNVQVLHFKHEGTGAARNAGIRIAKGEYIHFVDADDEVFPNTYLRLLHLIRDQHADIVQFKLIREGEELYSSQEECIEYTGSIREYIRDKAVKVSPCNKWFRTEFLISHDISFPSYSYSEDTAFIWDALKSEGTLFVTNLQGYHYLVGKNSLERSREVEIVKQTIEDLLATNIRLKQVASCYNDCPAVKGNFSHKYRVLFNRILFTPYPYQELKAILSQCAKIGTSHLHASKRLWIINFLYHHPVLFFVCRPFLYNLFSRRHAFAQGSPDFINKRL